MKKRLTTYILILLLLFAVSGCGESENAEAPVKAKNKVKKKSTSVPVVVDNKQVDVVYVYNPLGKRDPFENPLKSIVEIAHESGIPLTPLQKYDLGQLRLIGVIVGKGDPRAMVIAPGGKSFILNMGTKVGKNDGSVVDITTEAVFIKEKYYDFTGEIKTSVQEIRLPKQGGVK